MKNILPKEILYFNGLFQKEIWDGFYWSQKDLGVYRGLLRSEDEVLGDYIEVLGCFWNFQVTDFCWEYGFLGKFRK